MYLRFSVICHDDSPVCLPVCGVFIRSITYYLLPVSARVREMLVITFRCMSVDQSQHYGPAVPLTILSSGLSVDYESILLLHVCCQAAVCHNSHCCKAIVKDCTVCNGCNVLLYCRLLYLAIVLALRKCSSLFELLSLEDFVCCLSFFSLLYLQI